MIADITTGVPCCSRLEEEVENGEELDFAEATMSEETEPQEYEEWREREKHWLEQLEQITSSPQVEQEKILKHILSKNAATEYLQRYRLNGATDVQSFRECLPVSDYDSYKPFVDRIYNGDKSPLLCADTVVELLHSSGTSGGERKVFPVTAEELEIRHLVSNFSRPVLNRALPGLEKGKTMKFIFMKAPRVLPCGLLCHSATSSFQKSSGFIHRPFDPTFRSTSPDTVSGAIDNDDAIYCHLLLGLLQREEVARLAAIYAVVILRVLRKLEEWWQEICEDIANGTLSSRVKDESVRSAVLPMLRKDTELAEFVRNEFYTNKSSDGIIRRLWPNVKVLDTICTGSMEAYLPALANYSDNLPVVCARLYAATEGFFGVNLNPMCPPKEVYYTLIPFSAYYEFIALSTGNEQKSGLKVDEVLDLMSLKEGQEYELLVTTVSGLYRYRMGDVLKLIGYYNSAPTFQFMRRLNIVLSIYLEQTDENELHTAVSRATRVLEREAKLRLLDYTSACDFSTQPGHYVIYWELVPSSHSPTQDVLEGCCSAMEATLSFLYRRKRNENIIGALELRLLQEGTFDLLAKHAIARGANLTQYKTPRGLDTKRSAALLDILNTRVSQKSFAQENPPYTPAPGITHQP